MEFSDDGYKSDAAVNDVVSPEFFRLENTDELSSFNKLLSANSSIILLDDIEAQLRELIKSRNPSVKLKSKDYEDLIKDHLGMTQLSHYGVWVYFPWNQRMVHILDEDEFVEIRTNRNRYKITQEEQDRLKEKKIGIVGLSVGQSIALTIAMERGCGELRLADFDTAELSNLNRIRTSITNLGLKKTVIAAREIAEIDPFLRVRIFSDGLNNDNLDEFFTDGGKLDVLVEVCDGLDIKIISRYKAKELRIPVVMDTNDRGLLDVERFDLEPERPILHGLAEGLDANNIRDLTNEEKIPYILRMVNAENISTRLKASMIEVEQTINTWPQLASSVVLGGAVTTDVCRRILLNQFHESGRYYIDLENLIKDQKDIIPLTIPPDYFPPKIPSNEDLCQLATGYSKISSVSLSEATINQIILAATSAPSGGNSQPWKFLYMNNCLFVFHDLECSYSFLDFNSYGAFVALGAAIENIAIKSDALGYEAVLDLDPLIDKKPLIAVIGFKNRTPGQYNQVISDSIDNRLTNRNIDKRETLSAEFYDDLKAVIEDPAYEGASLDILDNTEMMAELGDILATSEKLVLMHPRGHFDAFKKELRWTDEESNKKRDGLDVATLGISKGEISALRIANDHQAIGFLRETIRGGDAFKKMAAKAVAASSALGVVSMPRYSELAFLLGGRAVERIWLEATSKEVSFQPITQFTFLLARLVEGEGIGLDYYYKKEFNTLKNRFFALLPHLENRKPVFIFRLCKAKRPEVKSLRKPLDKVRITF